MMMWLIIGGVAVLVGGLALISRARERKRRTAFQEFSAIRGFTFESERPEGERRYSEVFQPFNEGRRRTWGYTISGTKNEAPFTAFEYHWVTGSGKHSRTHGLSGIVWERSGLALPKFALSPEGWFSRLGEIFGMQDIDFVESAEFSKTYRLKGPDEAAIRTLFTPEIRQFFGATPNQYVAGGGQFLFWFRSRNLPPPGELDEWLEQGEHVRRRFFQA